MRLETVSPGPYRCGEGPIWDAVRARLLFTDIEAARIHAYDPAKNETVLLQKGLAASALALNETGELLVAGSTGLHLWRGPGDHATLLEEAEGEPLVLNDVLADPAGRLYAGTLHWGPAGMEKPGKLFLIERELDLRAVDEGIELSNGLGLSPDGRTLYFTDSAARRIYAYDVDPESGGLSRKRVLVQVPGDEGIPDGLTVDSEGFIWSAQWYGSQVVRYDPEGAVETRIPVPARQVSSLAFGGADLLDLYITSASEPWPSPLAPRGYDFRAPDVGGPLFRARLDVPGRPEHRAGLACR